MLRPAAVEHFTLKATEEGEPEGGCDCQGNHHARCLFCVVLCGQGVTRAGEEGAGTPGAKGKITAHKPGEAAFQEGPQEEGPELGLLASNAA